MRGMLVCANSLSLSMKVWMLEPMSFLLDYLSLAMHRSACSSRYHGRSSAISIILCRTTYKCIIPLWSNLTMRWMDWILQYPPISLLVNIFPHFEQVRYFCNQSSLAVLSFSAKCPIFGLPALWWWNQNNLFTTKPNQYSTPLCTSNNVLQNLQGEGENDNYYVHLIIILNHLYSLIKVWDLVFV